MGSDILKSAVDAAWQHADQAKLKGKINFFYKSFEQAEPPLPAGIVIMNPPYGERLQQEDIHAFYKSIGDTLKRKYESYTVWIFSSNTDAVKHIGLRYAEKFRLKNGPLDCVFLRFDITGGKYIKQAKVNS